MMTSQTEAVMVMTSRRTNLVKWIKLVDFDGFSSTLMQLKEDLANPCPFGPCYTNNPDGWMPGSGFLLCGTAAMRRFAKFRPRMDGWILKHRFLHHPILVAKNLLCRGEEISNLLDSL